MNDPSVSISQKAEPSALSVTAESVSATGMSFVQAKETKPDSEVRNHELHVEW